MTEEKNEAETADVVSDDQLLDNALAELGVLEKPEPAEVKEETKQEANPESGEVVDAVPAEAEQKEEKPKGEQKLVDRIGKLTRQKYDLKAENERLQQELERYKQKEGEKPIRGSFPDDATFERALLKHELMQENAKERLLRDQEELGRKQAEEWEHSVREQVSDFDAFAKDYTSYYDHISKREPELVRVATSSAIAPKILEAVINEVYKKPQNLERWNSMSGELKRYELATLERELLNRQYTPQEPAPAAPRSNAPQVVAPEKKSLKQQGQIAATDDELVQLAMQGKLNG
jgi:hypothetical protein